MKLTAIISLLALTLLIATGTALAQQQQPSPRPAPRPTPAGPPEFGLDKKKCPCDILGTWKAQLSKNEARLYEFDGEGMVKVLTVTGDAKPREIATAKYEFVEEALPMESMGLSKRLRTRRSRSRQPAKIGSLAGLTRP